MSLPMVFTFPVHELRTFSYDNGTKRILAEVEVANLPTNFPDEVNARTQNLRTGVSRAIRQSMLTPETQEIFHLMNRGIVLTVANAEFDSKTRVLKLEMKDKSVHGVLDGGHTYKIVTKNAAQAPGVRVLLEVLTGIEDNQLADIVGARNTSVQVDAAALANVKGEFDPILDYLDSHGIPKDRIRVRQNEDKEINILDILALMFLFDVNTFGSDIDGADKPPILAFSAKGSVLPHFQNSRNQPVFLEKMLPILPDILHLWDYAAFRLQDHYRTSIAKPTGQIGKRIGVEVKDEPGLYHQRLKLKWLPHRAYRLPLMAAMRCLVDTSGPQWSWKPVEALPQFPKPLEKALGRRATPVERFYEDVAISLQKQLWQEADNSNPTKLGKTAMLWNTLYVIAWRRAQELNQPKQLVLSDIR